MPLIKSLSTPYLRLFAGWVLATSLAAQQPTPTPTPTPPPPTQTAPIPLILDKRTTCHAADELKGARCGLRDTLVVSFVNLKEWMASDPAKNDPQKLLLVLDGRVMRGLTARGPNTEYKELEFDLFHLNTDQPGAKENREAWNALLSRSKSDITMDVGVSLDGAPPIYGPARLDFRVFSSSTWPSLAILSGLVGLFLVLAKRSDLLRAPGPEPGPGKRLPYSLARCQMAWWFFIVIASYNYIWIVTGDRDSITTGALTLIGISAATGLSAVVVDSGKRQQQESLAAEQATLSTHIADFGNAVAAVPPPANLATVQTQLLEKQARMLQVKALLAGLPEPPGPSDGLLLDILRDGESVTFHRFQMIGWTLVLGLVFLVTVYRSLAMPDFSATLLGLMGISSGTYLGFKIPDGPK